MGMIQNVAKHVANDLNSSISLSNVVSVILKCLIHKLYISLNWMPLLLGFDKYGKEYQDNPSEFYKDNNKIICEYDEEEW